jgi:hypothetical protein
MPTGRAAETTPQPSPTQASTSPSLPPRLQSGLFGAMLDGIREQSPAGWQFTLRGDRLDGDWRLDGDADDGHGPGRLYIDVSVRPGMFVSHPCSDHEFSQGAPCIERPLPDGDMLVLRDIVIGPDGMKTIEVVLIHPDGSGIGAEAGNWTLSSPSGQATRVGLSTPRVTLPEPLYSVEELGRLVQRVDELAQACIRTSC